MRPGHGSDKTPAQGILIMTCVHVDEQIAPMLTFNIYTGVLQRRRQSWTALPFFVLWWVLCFVSFAAVIFADCTELGYSGFPPEDRYLKNFGAP